MIVALQPIRATASRIVIPVRDYREALDFYSRLLMTEGTPVSEGRTYFDLGGVTLCIYHPLSDGDEAVGVLSTPVYLSVDDISMSHANATQAEAADLGCIERRPWGERSFYCRDPSGNRLCFVENNSMFRGEFFVE